MNFKVLPRESCDIVICANKNMMANFISAIDDSAAPVI